MINECIFIVHSFVCAAASLFALGWGPYALCSLVSFQCILSNILVLKQVTLFGLVATCADPFTIGATIGFNLMQEFYGRKIARQSIFVTFFLLIFYTISTHVHMWYAPASVDTMQGHYQALFGTTLRIATASLVTYFIVQWVDYLIYGFLKVWFNKRRMLLRALITIVICQAIDTLLFTFLGLGSIVIHPWHVVLVSYAIKLIAAVFGIMFIKICSHFFCF